MTLNGSGAPILELRDIRKEYILRRGLLERLTRPAQAIAAVDGVSLAIPSGSIFGLVGESGSGKSTLAQIIVRLVEPTAGQLLYRGTDIATLPQPERTPSSATASRWFSGYVFLPEPAQAHPPRARRGISCPRVSAARRMTDEIAMLMRQVGLDAALLRRFPHELSGGQRQRVGIARALAMSPEILVADEPVSSLDVSLQGQIINLLQELNRELGLTIVLISHDLAIVARICSRIAVMSAGKIVESGPPGTVLVTPSHPYTQTLIDAIPRGIAGRRRADEPRASAREPAYEAAAQ